MNLPQAEGAMLVLFTDSTQGCGASANGAPRLSNAAPPGGQAGGTNCGCNHCDRLRLEQLNRDRLMFGDPRQRVTVPTE